MSLRLVQLSDLHLYKDKDGLLAGVPTWSTFRAVLEQVRSRHGDFDYLILTGDLAQDEALETYLMLREALGDWLDRCRIIPGNHDDRDNLRKAFPELFPNSETALTFELLDGGWCIVGLDSHVPGETTGRVGGEQIDWLKSRLSGGEDLPVLMFIHHPPVPINVAWLDDLGLNESTGLIELIENSPQMKMVCAGHVHQEFSGQIGAAAMCTTPSTCVQFSARAEKAFDTRMAGYRTFTLDANDYRTEVHRLTKVVTFSTD